MNPLQKFLQKILDCRYYAEPREHRLSVDNVLMWGAPKGIVKVFAEQFLLKFYGRPSQLLRQQLDQTLPPSRVQGEFGPKMNLSAKSACCGLGCHCQ